MRPTSRRAGGALTTTCGHAFHLLGGYIPAMRARVMVCSFISCGERWYCRNELLLV
jgi:hypothetical protein